METQQVKTSTSWFDMSMKLKGHSILNMEVFDTCQSQELFLSLAIPTYVSSALRTLARPFSTGVKVTLNWALLFHRFFFGKNKVMMVALGKGETDEYKDNLHKVGKILLLPENTMLIYCKELKLLLPLIMHRSASIYEERWEYFSQIKQRMKYKSE